MSRIHLVRETWDHMSTVSGFDPLFSCIENSPGLQTVNHFVPKELPPPGRFRRLVRRLVKEPSVIPPVECSPWVCAQHVAIARECLQSLESNPEDKLLLSVGDNQYARLLADAPPTIKTRIFAFFHQPPAWFRLHWKDFEALNGLGGIFALCQEQANFFHTVENSPVHVVRHGVCSDFFTPVATPPTGAPRFVFVGQWLRDFDTLVRTIPLVQEQLPEARFDLVIPRSARELKCLYPLAMRNEVNWHAGIDAARLLELYHGASALLLPLIDSTANNAVLEAMACGLPIVTTDIGGIRDYLPESAGIFCPSGDAEAHSKATISMVTNPGNARTMGDIARKYVEGSLNWERIAGNLLPLLAPR